MTAKSVEPLQKFGAQAARSLAWLPSHASQGLAAVVFTPEGGLQVHGARRAERGPVSRAPAGRLLPGASACPWLPGRPPGRRANLRPPRRASLREAQLVQAVMGAGASEDQSPSLLPRQRPRAGSAAFHHSRPHLAPRQPGCRTAGAGSHRPPLPPNPTACGSRLVCVCVCVWVADGTRAREALFISGGTLEGKGDNPRKQSRGFLATSPRRRPRCGQRPLVLRERTDVLGFAQPPAGSLHV